MANKSRSAKVVVRKRSGGKAVKRQPRSSRRSALNELREVHGQVAETLDLIESIADQREPFFEDTILDGIVLGLNDASRRVASAQLKLAKAKAS